MLTRYSMSLFEKICYKIKKNSCFVFQYFFDKFGNDSKIVLPTGLFFFFSYFMVFFFFIKLKRLKCFFFAWLSMQRKRILNNFFAFKQRLRLVGMGFNVEQTSSKIITVHVGKTKSHKIVFFYITKNILSYRINKKGRKLVFVGFNFQKLKDFIIAVCNLYKIGPYKNKGIRLRYEIIFRKKVKRKDKRKKIKK